jgi:hypothetical protein
MIPLLKDNYITQTGEGDTFQIKVEKIKRPFGNYYEESKLAAEEIYDLKEGPLHVMYSGGLDSEYVLSVFRSLGMDITPVIVRLNPNYNDHDIFYAFEYCKEHNIEPIIVDIDYKWFVESGLHLKTAIAMKCSKFHYVATGYAITQVDGSVLLGEGETHLAHNKKTNLWNLEIDEHDYVFPKLMEKFGIDGTAQFNRWRPGMLASSMLDPYYVELGNNRVPGHTTSNDGKIELYNRNSPFKLKPRPKYTGYEIIQTAPDIIHQKNWSEMKHRGKAWNWRVSIEYNDFVNNYIEQDV